MRIRGLACLLLAGALAGCGETQPTPPARQPEPEAQPVSIVLLDPAGRMLDVGEMPAMFVLDGGEVLWPVGAFGVQPVHELEAEPPAGAELLVIAPGCRPARVPLGPGRNVVRLEPGFPVHVALEGWQRVSAPGARHGLSLELRVREVLGVRLPSEVVLRPLAAGAFEADRAGHPQYVRVPERGALDLLVPVAGRYDLDFTVRVGNAGYGVGDDQPPHLLTPETRTLVVTWPAAAFERFLEDR